MLKRLLLLCPIFLSVLLLYQSALTTYFSQDDFFHFKVSRTDGSFLGFLNFFGFYSFEERGIAFYRPLFREVLYNAFYSVFGLNPLPFRVLSFLLHFVNIYLVYKLLNFLFKNKFTSWAATFFFAIAPANVSTLYYLAGGIQSLGATMFILLCLIFFLRWLDEKRFIQKLSSFLFFILALASHEQAAVTPFLVAGLIFVKKPVKEFARIFIKDTWPFFAVLPIFLYLDVSVIGFSRLETQYSLVFSLKSTLNTLIWYIVWAWGIPEMLIDFVRPGLKLNPSLMRHWGDYFTVIFPAFFISLGLFIANFVYLNYKVKIFWFFAFWFMALLLPIVFLPFHKSTYYLYPALPAFWAGILLVVFSGYGAVVKRYRLIAGISLGALVAAFFVLALTSTILGKNTYWAVSRGSIAKKLISSVVEAYPTLPKGVVVYFKNDPAYPFIAQTWGGTSKQASFVLNGSDALQLVYKDPTLKVFYEDLGGVPEVFPKESLYEIVAKIN